MPLQLPSKDELHPAVAEALQDYLRALKNEREYQSLYDIAIGNTAAAMTALEKAISRNTEINHDGE